MYLKSFNNYKLIIMKINISTLTFLSIPLFLISSCSSEDDNKVFDTEKPVITLLNPADHDEFLPGDTIDFRAQFADNDALASYKLEIHIASDGHTHGKGMLDEHADWFFTEIHQFESNTKNIEVQKQISIPTHINQLPIEERHYHLGIYLIDRSGNEQQEFVEIAIGEHHHG